MCITVDDAIDETIRERFETVLPDGSVSAAFIDAGGRAAYMPGRVDPEAFAQEVDALIALSTAAGLAAEDALAWADDYDALTHCQEEES